MANEAYTRTNQSLHFAATALVAWQQADASAALDARTQVRYQRETCLFHLYRGVLALIHEVADFYRWPLLDMRDVEAVLSVERLADFPGPELGELTELAQRQDAWLAQMLFAWRALLAPPAAEAKQPAPELIVRVGGQATSGWSIEQADAALQGLKSLVSRQRELMQEW
ncbi:MAG: PasA protein [Pseudomonadaceae bacterium]|nr:MAG: PasA protein [Pseudomonadaceae bacterium]